VVINAPLSCDEFRSFVVNWSTDGNIQIGTNSFLYVNVTDPAPLPVNGLGIMTAYGATGLWMFDLAGIYIRLLQWFHIYHTNYDFTQITSLLTLRENECFSLVSVAQSFSFVCTIL
jgi:hypothetical protein